MTSSRAPDLAAAPADQVCVHDLIRSQIARTPRAVAIIDRGQRITYRALAERVDHLTAVLLRAGVGPESRVGIGCRRSLDMVVAVLAVLEAGGAYVPLDPSHPRARLALVCEDAGLELVLTQRAVADRLAGLGPHPLCVDALPDPALDGARHHPPRPAVTADGALFVLYTSGSTGRPKGVVGVHRAIVSRLLWAEETYPYQPGEVASARTTLGFVDSVAELFAPLAFGVPLVLVDDELQGDPAAMLDVLAGEAVSRIVMVPSLLAALLEQFPDLGARVPRLRYWFVGGEPVPLHLVASFFRQVPGARLLNIYGATELSGDATCYDFDDLPPGLRNAPIGTALRGVWARVLDRELREVPDGDEGEVCVSGVCLARGYLGQPELTGQRFVANPFPEGGRLYRTGDRGRRLPDGAIEYLGRIDRQVKVRGVRVELGEVEAALDEVVGVGGAVAVVGRDRAGHDALVGYYLARPGHAVDAAALRDRLAARLPAAMVPAHLVALDRFPASATGKVDRRALAARPLPSVTAASGAGGAPLRDDDERAVAASFAEVLGCGPLGRDHDFTDLGGTSLGAIRVAARIGARLGVTVPVADVLAHPTVAGLAARVRARRQVQALPARARAPLPVGGRPLPAELPLAFHQVPFWLFHALTGGGSVVGEVFGFAAPVDVDRLQRAYADTVASLDTVWMRYPRWRPVQRPAPRYRVALEVRDRRGDPRPEAEVVRADAAELLDRPFDLDRPPHVHACLVRVPSGDDRLVLAIPHVAVDLSAMEIIRQRLAERYSGATPAAGGPADATIADVVAWQRRPAALRARDAAPDGDAAAGGHGDADDDDRRAARYWDRIGRGPAVNRVAAPNLAPSAARGRARAFSQRALDDAVVAGLHRRARAAGASLPLVLVAGIYAGLARATGVPDLSLVVTLDQRDRPELDRTVATLTTVVRFALRGCADADLDDIVARTRDQLLASYPHADGVLRHPVWFNDFWDGAPRAVRRAVELVGRALTAAWPGARLPRDLLAAWLFAIVPRPSLARRASTTRDLTVVVNVLPEVYRPEPATGPGAALVRRRELDLTLVPADLIVAADPLVARTLQVHVSRDPAGRLAVNLWGGGFDQAGLDRINASVAGALDQIAAGLTAPLAAGREVSR